MQIGDIGAAAPIAAIERVGTQQVHRSRDRLYPVPCDDEDAAVGHALAHQVDCFSCPLVIPPFSLPVFLVKCPPPVPLLFSVFSSFPSSLSFFSFFFFSF